MQESYRRRNVGAFLDCRSDGIDLASTLTHCVRNGYCLECSFQ